MVPASILEGHAVKEGNYDASAIQVLEGLEAVRKRPGMYIGSTGERGLHHLVSEVVDNSVDEALAGYCDRVEVTILSDGAVQVSDNGRGIPVDIPPGQELPAVTVVLTVLHAGGKFGGSGYKVSGGLHGVGVSVVNALSKRVEVDIKRDGFHWFQAFEMGVPTGPLEKGEPTDETGTTTRFWANDDIFETTNYSFETLANRFREMAFLNKGLEIVVRDERPAAAAVGRRRPGRDRVQRDRQRRLRRPARHRHRRDGAPVQVRPRPGRLRRAPQPAQGQGQPEHHQLRGRDRRSRPRTT